MIPERWATVSKGWPTRWCFSVEVIILFWVLSFSSKVTHKPETRLPGCVEIIKWSSRAGNSRWFRESSMSEGEPHVVMWWRATALSGNNMHLRRRQQTNKRSASPEMLLLLFRKPHHVDLSIPLHVTLNKRLIICLWYIEGGTLTKERATNWQINNKEVSNAQITKRSTIAHTLCELWVCSHGRRAYLDGDGGVLYHAPCTVLYCARSKLYDSKE